MTVNTNTYSCSCMNVQYHTFGSSFASLFWKQPSTVSVTGLFSPSAFYYNNN